jgi:hypothetical protein
MPPTAVLVRAAEALGQLERDATGTEAPPPEKPQDDGAEPTKPKSEPRNPRRFYGSVEIDMVRPMKAFDSIFNAVVMELQRTQGAKVKLTLEIEAEAPTGFAEGEVGVVRDNARQLKFKAESTGFEE